MSILFINACVRENSRTLTLAKQVLKDLSGDIVEVNLEQEELVPLNRDTLEKREALIREGRFDDPMLGYARQFAEAEEIVIAAPFWDLSFPAWLKIYLEQVTVSGITFRYNNGRPVGMCHAKRLIYVTTSGGPIMEGADFGYTYVKTLAQNFYGISQTKAVRAMNLDVEMISADELLEKAKISVIE